MKLSLLNLGCGSRFHKDWTNVDFHSSGPQVIAHNLRAGIPFKADAFDAVYHSHLLEHLSKDEAPGFLQECFRVLKPNGILRVVIPDLERIVRCYLDILENSMEGDPEAQNRYDWILLELMDQMVRNVSGGEMLKYWKQNPMPAESFVIERQGAEVLNFINAHRMYPDRFAVDQGQNLPSAEEIGKFRQSGEIHQWMYDRYSLKKLLGAAGFTRIKICRADESGIHRFNDYLLDIEPGGSTRKPDSLFMEAVKAADPVELSQQGMQNRNETDDIVASINRGIAKLDQDPDHVPTLLEMGFLMLDLERWDAATLQFRHALRAAPDSSRVRHLLTDAAGQMVRRGQIAYGRVLYLSLLSGRPDDEINESAWSALADSEDKKTIVETVRSESSDYRVSAIVSTYRSAGFIQSCLENLLSQSIADAMEIVIVDAASPENEGDIIHHYMQQHKNITYLRTKARIGIYAAWNIAIAQATGKYCISVSTNDHLARNACEVLAGELDMQPDAALVFGDTYLTRHAHETFEHNRHYGVYQWGPYSFDQHTKDGCCIGPHPMWRRSVHASAGYFDERFISVGDQEFWMRLGAQYGLKHIPRFTGLQWITAESLSGSGDIPAMELDYIKRKYQKSPG